jgi:DedD protein
MPIFVKYHFTNEESLLSTPFQNRLVGTIIVAAVVIIFLPDLLDGEKKSYQAEFEAIPKADDFSGQLTSKSFSENKLVRQKVTAATEEVAVDELEVNSENLIETELIAIDTTNKKLATNDKNIPVKAEELSLPHEKLITEIVVKEQLENNSMPVHLPEKAIAKEAWAIHLGSFKNEKNVEQLLKKLKVNGYVVFTKPIKTKQGMLTKVIIGPELIKSTLVKKLPALKKLTGIQGKVAYFDPKK